MGTINIVGKSEESYKKTHDYEMRPLVVFLFVVANAAHCFTLAPLREVIMRRTTIYAPNVLQLRRARRGRNVTEELVQKMRNSRYESDSEWDDSEDSLEVSEDTLDLLRSRAPTVRTLFPEAWHSKHLKNNVGVQPEQHSKGKDDSAVFDCSPACSPRRHIDSAAIDELPVVLYEDSGVSALVQEDDDTWGSEPGEAMTHDQSCECFNCARERLRREQWQFPYEQYDPSDFIDEEQERERRREAAASQARKVAEVKPTEVKVRENPNIEAISKVFSRPHSGKQSETTLSPRSYKPSPLRQRVFFRPSEVNAMKDLPRIFSSPKSLEPVVAASVFSTAPEISVLLRPSETTETVVTLAPISAFSSSPRAGEYRVATPVVYGPHVLSDSP
ncbi:hypothetical protein GYMLUDRAFT_246255 [Collybiopsis luxurians FD-317 M1]|uniref:Uncharacterized protein n=1 Tax=Collybiopsis luxurians FD-317 M1 TaxID=944289 RepID=A0A0D0C6S1_9AGAR|nr:hypothetical protein GYMLUDRAFT_246255 [Collybiopsis luxurians FD-317 M1]